MADADTGVNAFAQGVNKGIQGGLEDWNRIAANGKIADTIAKVNPEILDQLGISSEQFSSQSAQAKSQMIQGVFQAQGAQRQQQLMAAQLADYMSQAQERASVGQWRQAQASRADQQDNEDAATGQALQRFYSTPPPAALLNYGGTGDPTAQMQAATDGATAQDTAPSPQDRMRYAMATPGLGGRSAANLFKMIQQYGQGDGTAPVTAPGPYPGQSIVYSPGSKSFQLVNDPSTAGAMVPQTDENGNIIGYTIPTRNGSRFVPPPKTMDASLVDTRTQSALSAWHKRLDPLQTQVEFAAAKVNDPKASDEDKAKYKALLPGLTSQRDAVLKERPAMSTKGAAPSGTGTQADPASPASQSEFDALPSKTWFVNPADGKLMQKK